MSKRSRQRSREQRREERRRKRHEERRQLARRVEDPPPVAVEPPLPRAAPVVGPFPTGRVQSVTFQQTMWTAPLPPPEMLQQYDKAFPGCAERIVAMAERQQAHRIGLERTVVEGNTRHASRGQIVGAIVMVLAVIGGFVLLYTGKTGEGFATLVGNVLLYGSAWVFAKKQQRDELEKKRPEPPKPDR